MTKDYGIKGIPCGWYFTAGEMGKTRQGNYNRGGREGQDGEITCNCQMRQEMLEYIKHS